MAAKHGERDLPLSNTRTRDFDLKIIGKRDCPNPDQVRIRLRLVTALTPEDQLKSHRPRLVFL